MFIYSSSIYESISFISFLAKKETNQRKMLDGLNSLRLLRRLRSNRRPSEWYFLNYAMRKKNKLKAKM
jgi:hypothetical protein